MKRQKFATLCSNEWGRKERQRWAYYSKTTSMTKCYALNVFFLFRHIPCVSSISAFPLCYTWWSRRAQVLKRKWEMVGGWNGVWRLWCSNIHIWGLEVKFQKYKHLERFLPYFTLNKPGGHVVAQILFGLRIYPSIQIASAESTLYCFPLN